MASLVSSFLASFLAPSCPLCDRTGHPFCPDCERQLKRCQLAQPLAHWRGPVPQLSWGRYQGQLKQAIRHLKYHHQPQVAQPLGHWLGQVWLGHQSRLRLGQSPVVVPIPLHPTRQAERGYNQAQLLAEAFCRTTRLPLAPGLQRVENTVAQYSLSAIERQRNLASAFAPNPAWTNLRSQPVLLLDDIYTTGATANSAAIALNRQGIRVVGVLTVARAIQPKGGETG
jgi:ComF family protein